MFDKIITKKDIWTAVNRLIYAFVVLFFLLYLIYVVQRAFSPLGNLPLAPSPSPTHSLSACSRPKPDAISFSDGDIIFQYLHDSPNLPTDGAKNSSIDNCGLIFIDNEEIFVIESGAEGVRKVFLKEWIWKGRDKKFAIYRLRGADEKTLQKIVAWAKKWVGKPCNGRLGVQSNENYPAEFVFQAYQSGASINLISSEADFINSKGASEKKVKIRDLSVDKIMQSKKLNRVYSDFD